MLPQGIKTAPYLKLTLNLKNIIDLIYKYSENRKWKNKNKLQRRLLNEEY